MSYRCPKCDRVATLRVPLPDHVPTAVRCRHCKTYMTPHPGEARP